MSVSLSERSEQSVQLKYHCDKMKANEGYVENKVSGTYRIFAYNMIGICAILLTNCRNALGISDSDKRTTKTDGANWSE